MDMNQSEHSDVQKRVRVKISRDGVKYEAARVRITPVYIYFKFQILNNEDKA